MKWSVLLLGIVYAKYVSTVITLNPDNPWKYVSKFASHIGKGTWEMKAKLMKIPDPDSKDFIDFVGTVYIDNKWEDALSQSSCEAKELASRRQKTLRVPLNGEWSDPIDGTLTQSTRTHFWYFSISSCKIIEKYKLRVEMQFINADGSEFSAEDHGLQYVYPVIMLIFLIALSGNIFRLVRKFQKTDDLESNLLILNIAIACQLSGIFFVVIHFWIYAYNGKGFVVFDVFYQALEVLSSVMVTILLILIASGWTLKYRNFPDADVYIPISLFVVILNLMIVGLGRITEDSYYKHSDYEGIPGFFLIVMRIALWLWFLYLIQEMKQKANEKMMGFLIKFSIMASLYFLALPALVIFSWIFEAYVRNKVVVLLVNLIQISVFMFLTHLFSEKSTFYKISTMSESVLPGKSQ